MTQLPNIHVLERPAALEAQFVSVFVISDGSKAGSTVVEVLDAHHIVIARTVTDRPGSREDLADAVLQRSALERCGDFTIVPAKRHKRINALVTLRTSTGDTTLGALRAQGGMGQSA